MQHLREEVTRLDQHNEVIHIIYIHENGFKEKKTENHVSVAREPTDGGFGGAVSPETRSRGSTPENFEILVPLDAQKWLFQHAFNE